MTLGHPLSVSPPGRRVGDATIRIMAWAPLVYAHRLGSRYGPESSRAALEKSLSGDVEGLEADVVLTADDDVLACHDPLLSISTADFSGWAHEHTAAELTQARLVDGEGKPSDQTVMSLRELLEAIPPDLPLQLDVKAYADPERARRTSERCCEIAEELRRSEQVEIISFFTAACEAATSRGFAVRIVAWADYDPPALARWAVEHGAGGLSLEGFILGSSLHRAIREADLTLSVGAVNDAAQLRRIAPFAPEIIVSDCPSELRGALAELDSAPAATP
jgi:glycerophosphoryl diester phosphodiesterase